MFAYGSLAGRPDRLPTREDGSVRDLVGYRRRFGVAMDNGKEIPGYKVYEEPESSERPAVFVAFLDLVPAGHPGAAVNGVLLSVAAPDLERLDHRERNYRRVEVTGLVRPAVSVRVWAYVGSPAGRQRLAEGRVAGRAVISRAYREGVEAGFRALGEEEWRRYAASTDEPRLPTRSLRRVDVPAG